MRRRKATVYVSGDDKAACTALARRLRSATFDAETFSSVDEFLSEPERKGCLYRRRHTDGGLFQAVTIALTFYVIIHRI